MVYFVVDLFPSGVIIQKPCYLSWCGREVMPISSSATNQLEAGQTRFFLLRPASLLKPLQGFNEHFEGGPFVNVVHVDITNHPLFIDHEECPF